MIDATINLANGIIHNPAFFGGLVLLLGHMCMFYIFVSTSEWEDHWKDKLARKKLDKQDKAKARAERIGQKGIVTDYKS